ncbi:serine hydrolase [Candidatus Parcubacteria bacterium]|nr:MAG: serine hydrolase [Candidatus Parcubacteria bacterium]
MKKFFLILFYSAGLLLLGRNLLFLPIVNPKTEEQKSELVKQKVAEFISKEDLKFSVYYKDLVTGQTFGIDENKVLTGASLNKLVIVAYLYNLAKDNKINLEEKVVVQKEDIQDYGTGSIRYDEPGKVYSLKTLAKLSLEQSDNTAAHLLVLKLGVDEVEEYRKRLGLVATDMENNKTSSRDMGKLLDLVYSRKITSEALTLELLDFMKDTDFEDRIPRFIDGDVKIYHKTGDAVGMIHDVAIVEGKRKFILSVLTSEVGDEEKAKNVIGRLAKIIYDGD